MDSINVDNMVYKILPKNSASPTIMIINKKLNVIYKIWSATDRSEEASGLSYENRIYANKINPMLDKKPNLPLLKYIGYGEMNVGELKDVLGVTDRKALFILYIAFYEFFKRSYKGI